MQIINVPAGVFPLVLGEDILAMNTAKLYLQCQTSDGAINILLPKITIPAGGSLQNWWFNVYINDIGGNASVNNIKITPHPDDTINGSSSQIILIDNGATGCLNVVGREAWEFETGDSSSGGGIHFVTYQKLLSLSTANSLVVGNQYVITNFRTREIIPNTTDIVLGEIEPLITTAVSSSEISVSVLSTVFPADELLYELVDSTTSGGDRGKIYYRRDTLSENTKWYDWRTVKFRRWDDGTGNFIILTDNGNAFQDFYAFNNSPSADSCFSNKFGQITEIGITLAGASPDKLDNFIIQGGALDNIFGNDCFNNTITGVALSNQGFNLIYDNVFGDSFNINNIDSSFHGNIIGNNCLGNTFGFDINTNQIGNNFLANTIGDTFQNNTIADDCEANVFGFGAASNMIGEEFVGNTLAVSFSANTIGGQFNGNIIGSNFSSNTIGNNFSTNSIGSGFGSNGIGNSFSDNTIRNNFNSNTVANNFVNNEIFNEFGANIVSENNFQKNHIESDLTGFTFGVGAQVYNDYTKNIFKRSDGSYQLSYIDNTNTIQYTAPDA